ncbi:raffinose/stachyose/melibiose transport system permease protein [Paenibacillus sp. UNCCL117]|uniref:carbohydrate ABC transporter permease n=1 Tax=unclassified Paenibacillus TaxID=185978 RepID=UPI0008807C2D|nr:MULTISPECIES: carbohydrate ABC transporter permease [unclassified Paenibacillus]SDC16677.1 carbohydrate ABC transporter membrane protein 2, CUT1 family [Paenibacillus sp. cl123]SFW17842.1 raffinose/stachyose/melibiose transport system permease protein [Paenibacillus sp. UNCCL117]
MGFRLFVRKTSVYFIMIAALILSMFPFAMLLINSFKTNAQILASPFSLPGTIDFTNFKVAIQQMNYFRSFINTIIITFSSVAIILLFSSMTAHYFVRNKSKLNNLLFMLMVSSMIIPFQSIMIPLVSVYGKMLGWINVMPQPTLIFMYIGFGSPLAVFIYHGFIKSLPFELEQAAYIDGCSRRQTFFKIVLPILSPTSVTIAILHILWIWNDFLLPLIVLQNAGKEMLTLPLAIQVFKDIYSTDYAKFLPGILLITLPVLLIYVFAQRYIIQGVTQGAVK